MVGDANTQTSMSSADLDSCLVLIQKGDTGEAKNLLQNYRRTNPDDPRALFYLAQLEGEYDYALALYREVERLALRTESGYADSTLACEAVFACAEMMFAKGGYDGARELYDRIIDVYPESGWYGDALYRLGLIELASGEPELALPMFWGYLDLYPEGNQRVLVSVGIMECYVNLKDWKNVLVVAQDALQERDENSAVTPRILEAMAEACEELGNKESAALYRGKLLTTYPESYQAYVLREKEKGGKREEISLGSIDPISPSQEAGGAGEKQSPDRISQESVREMEGGFSVQASAFEMQSNAAAMVSRLENYGFDARINSKSIGGKQFFKVLIGHYRTREEAEAMVEQVTKTTGIKAYVVILE